MIQMNLSVKQTHRHKEQTCGPKKKGGRGRMDWESEKSRCKLVYTEWIDNKVLLHSTGTYVHHPVITYNGREYENVCMYN